MGERTGVRSVKYTYAYDHGIKTEIDVISVNHVNGGYRPIIKVKVYKKL